MSKKMLIDARHPEETRVALLSGGKVEDFDFESLSRRPLRGNIYLARVTRVEPSLQAAFVEYGGNRHGFLAFSEIHPDYYQIPVADRDVLRAAEALEAELAAKLADLDEHAVDVEDAGIDDDDSEVEASETVADDDSAAEDDTDTAKADDDDESRPRRGRGRRRRGGRGRRGGRNRSSNDDETSEDAVTAKASSEDVASSSAESDTADRQETSSADGDYAGGAEEPDWHGADESLIEALPQGTGDEETTDGDDDPDGDGPPKSAALSARTEPHLTAEIPDDEESTDSNEPVAENASNDKEDASDTAERDDEEASGENIETASDADDAEPSQEDGDDAENADGGDEPKSKSAEPSEDELEAKRRAAEIASLQKRYDEARRERDRLLKNYRIQEVIKRRQIMLVQVVKEERGNKGAALTTYLSLAGRYGVLMPNNSRGGGVSRKISNQSDRRRLRKAIADLNVPKGQGLIIRTAGAKRTKAEIKRDYDYLARLWDTIRGQTMKSVAPCCIYEEASLIKRAIRDLYDKDTGEVLVEGEDGYREAKDFMKMLMPSHAKNVQPYRETEPLFLRHGVEKQLDEMYQPVVQLKSGGYIVIQQTEALISIDVNSGKSTKERNVEATALKTNTEAAAELARQCRLRDLAGLIVVDFIDMDENRNNRTVERKFKDALKADRARIQVGSISNFGLLEMSRQRRRSGIVDGTTRVCPSCEGAGFVRSVEMAALRILRSIEEKALSDRAGHVAASTSQEVAIYILNQKRSWLNRMEESYGVSIEITADPDKNGDQYALKTSGEARDVESLRQPAVVSPTDVVLDDEDEVENAGDNSDVTDESPETRADDDDGDKPKRRRKRGGRRKKDDADRKSADSAADSDEAESDGNDKAPAVDEAAADSEDDESDGEPKRKRRSRRGGSRRRKSADAGEKSGPDENDANTDKPEDVSTAEPDTSLTASEDRAASADVSPEAAPEPKPEPAAEQPVAEEPSPAPARRSAASIHAPIEEPNGSDEDKPKRGGWWQRAFGRD